MSKERVLAWTDGACLGNPGPGGWAALLRLGERERELVGHEDVTTNNRMELMAAIAALEAFKRPVQVVVHSDSSYVVKGMSEWVAGWQRNGWRSGREKKPVANRDLWERLVAAAAPHDVTWEWIRGHSGHVENERVDRLANAVAVRARDKDDVSVRVELEARLGIHCALASAKDAASKAPPFCARGPGNTGVHCLEGEGAACPHAFVVLDRSTLKLQDRSGGSASVATDATGKGPEVDRLRAILRSIAGSP